MTTKLERTHGEIMARSIKKAEFITRLALYLDALKELRSASDQINLYRGHSKTTYRLVPSLFRQKEHRRDEKSIRRELISLHPGEFVEDRSVFDQLVRMQHFSLLTRMMDVSYNPLVGLYFCCKGSRDEDGHVLQFTINKNKLKYYDSDAVTCVANLSNLSGGERNQLRAMETKTALCGSRAGKRLLQFIRAEKPHFLPEIIPKDLHITHIVKPKQNNKRIIAQQGAFLLFGLESELKDDNNSGIRVNRIDIPASAKKQLLNELDSININESALYPEIESAARYIMSKITPLAGDFED